MTNLKKIVSTALLLAALTGCSGMSAREQRMLSGGAIGAGAGAAVGGLSGGNAGVGAAIGGAAGVVGGAIVDEYDRHRYHRHY